MSKKTKAVVKTLESPIKNTEQKFANQTRNPRWVLNTSTSPKGLGNEQEKTKKMAISSKSL